MHFAAYTFAHLYMKTAQAMRRAPLVAPDFWQGVSVKGKPDMQTHEILNHSSELPLPEERLDYYQADIKPDLPWADNHFEERVCGFPINPGVEWAKWRLGSGAEKFLETNGMFNHNYMERIWPKYAGQVAEPTQTADDWLGQIGQQDRLALEHRGIRGPYGDLNSVVHLLTKNPLARQAYLPMFFPEDTGSTDRTPCSLGWHFIMRDNRLHMIYYLRSCDMFNHWRNDIYMAIRLLLWVLGRLREIDPDTWDNVRPGTLTTHITSLHVFRANFHQI